MSSSANQWRAYPRDRETAQAATRLLHADQARWRQKSHDGRVSGAPAPRPRSRLCPAPRTRPALCEVPDVVDPHQRPQDARRCPVAGGLPDERAAARSAAPQACPGLDLRVVDAQLDPCSSQHLQRRRSGAVTARILLRQRASESPTRSKQSNRDSTGGRSQHRRELLMTQPLPRDQKQQLLISFAQRPERPQHPNAQLTAGRRTVPNRSLTDQAVNQLLCSVLSAPPIREHPSRDPKQPRKRLIGHLVKASPRHEKNIRDQIISVAHVQPPTREPQHLPGIRQIQRLKPCPIVHQLRSVQLPHNPYTHAARRPRRKVKRCSPAQAVPVGKIENQKPLASAASPYRQRWLGSRRVRALRQACVRSMR